jgi:hypothetical protein
MKKIIILVSLLFLFETGYSQICCGGGVYDVAVLSLNKKALFNVGYKFDNYLGVWDSQSEWYKSGHTSYQMSPTVSVAFRFNRYIQAGVLIPYVINKNDLPGLNSDGSGIGDIVLSGRYELFHEYSLYLEKNKFKTDKKTPYIAITFGMTFPTGKSDENAESEVDITGKGFFTSSLGLSVIKTVLKNKVQFGGDFSWQHSFEKTYEQYYGNPTVPYERKQGDRFNYAVSVNYLINFFNSVSLAIGGFIQDNYSINGNTVDNSGENVLNFIASYTYYPETYIRITPLVKWNLPVSGIGKNSSGSLLLGINLVYYLENEELDDF